MEFINHERQVIEAASCLRIALEDRLEQDALARTLTPVSASIPQRLR
jgi:hypothetical protein